MESINASDAGSYGTLTGGEDKGLEDVTFDLMEQTGFMSLLKGQILEFIQNHGNLYDQRQVIPERINPIILTNIYEYLNWIGMKNTCTSLLNEVPSLLEFKPPPVITNNDEPTLYQMFAPPHIPDVSVDAESEGHLMNFPTSESETETEVDPTDVPAHADIEEVESELAESGEMSLYLSTEDISVPSTATNGLSSVEYQINLK